MLSFLKEFFAFIKARKNYYLIPVLIMLLVFGALIVLTKGTAVAPFIYTLF